MNIKTYRTTLFTEHGDLLAFISRYLKKDIREGSVVVVTSKIVALSEGRTAVATTDAAKQRLIRRESDFALKTKYTTLTLRDKTIMMSAGVDESNADGKIILLPQDSFKQARAIRTFLRSAYKLRRLGVIITDSRCMPLRAGSVGIALGYSGFVGLKKYAGKKDLFGRRLKVSRVDVADSLATAAVFCMGEGDERCPLALIEGAKVEWSDSTKPGELFIDPREDVYQPLFARIKKLRF